MKHTLPELPFSVNALEPYISAETFEYHHGKHHKAYIDKLNQLIPGTPFENQSLEEIVLGSDGPIFNNAAQAWNHDFFWKSLTPKMGKPIGTFMTVIQHSFGSFGEFEDNFYRSALDVFGSGWVWLSLDEK